MPIPTMKTNRIDTASIAHPLLKTGYRAACFRMASSAQENGFVPRRWS